MKETKIFGCAMKTRIILKNLRNNQRYISIPKKYFQLSDSSSRAIIKWIRHMYKYFLQRKFLSADDMNRGPNLGLFVVFIFFGLHLFFILFFALRICMWCLMSDKSQTPNSIFLNMRYQNIRKTIFSILLRLCDFWSNHILIYQNTFRVI